MSTVKNNVHHEVQLLCIFIQKKHLFQSCLDFFIMKLGKKYYFSTLIITAVGQGPKMALTFSGA